VYAVRLDGATVATFTLATTAPDYVASDVWDPCGEPAIYISRLAVHPERQGQGIGTECLDWVAATSLGRGFRAMRLDAVTAHKALLRFYRRLAFVEQGVAEAFGWQLTCFERLTDRA
jgi:GNAT superfamily N-acetyltransferase